MLVWSLIREPGIMMKEAQRLQFKPTYIYATPSISKKVLELSGDALDYNAEIYGTSIWVDALREETPNLKLLKETIDKYGMGSIGDAFVVYGFQSAITLVEGLKRAGKDLTREGLIKALETFKNFDNGILSPITWGPNLRAGGSSVKMFKVQGSEWHSIMDGWRYTKIKD
jgi:branched-chain amino acid transport system substrate-binding protein